MKITNILANLCAKYKFSSCKHQTTSKPKSEHSMKLNIILPVSSLESTQALALPKATSHFCLSCGDGALKYICCCPGITRSSLVLSIVFTGRQKTSNLYTIFLFIILYYANMIDFTCHPCIWLLKTFDSKAMSEFLKSVFEFSLWLQLRLWLSSNNIQIQKFFKKYSTSKT